MSSALKSDLESDLDQSGFVILGGAFGSDEASKLRSFLVSALEAHQQAMAPDDGILTDSALYDAVWPDFFQHNPDLFGALYNDRLVRSLQGLLGESFVVTRDSIAHWGYFPGWHTDTTTSEARGVLSHLEPDWRILTIGTYLQRGGGLEVVPGSHRGPDPFVAMRRRRDSDLGLADISDGLPSASVELPLVPGDVVIFNMRLIHRAATSTPRDDQGRTCQKLALFSRASRNIASHLEAYSDFRFNGAGTREDNMPQLKEYAAQSGFRLA